MTARPLSAKPLGTLADSYGLEAAGKGFFIDLVVDQTNQIPS